MADDDISSPRLRTVMMHYAILVRSAGMLLIFYDVRSLRLLFHMTVIGIYRQLSLARADDAKLGYIEICR